MQPRQIFPLSRLTAAIENVINSHCSRIVWVKAEIVRLNYYSHTGHCFPELVEKVDGKIIAEIRGNIWKANFEAINTKFKSVLNEDLGDDMSVVIQATVTYHPIYGLALNILDIDPEFTLGELARQKMETINKLRTENIFDSNKKTFLPPLPKTIALISVSSSKGYQDFMNVIENNPQDYQFHIVLFPAVLQGEKAVTTIMAALDRVFEYKDVFDAVVIVRGGGGEIGLSCYDNYDLARAIALFPLPILTGIGHSSNETVCEMVAYHSFITPTRIAGFLLEQYNTFAGLLKENIASISNQVEWLNNRENAELNELSTHFAMAVARNVKKAENDLKYLINAIEYNAVALLKSDKAELKNISTGIHYLDPQTILKRGFSITRLNGEVINGAAGVNPGDLLQTRLYDGIIKSRVETIEQEK
ncbi:exodeoxyribonuclease VII large subunit [Antarcticibacterium arcticum]|uniref:Exodeoxyribonuclease 7 large subunit n=1 Tax=Antarcticibacterium arcticum TaxID=2585771 RepID=A0A5B8YJP2_9FLAO|nr:exodeoxyribonuclease VII large subunit [Antarcticibacterium arcticum]QED37338.1 exodeoxyribonuclease VII large subunit [Antarcticibacterium arcticum]